MKKHIILGLSLLLILASCGVKQDSSSTGSVAEVTPTQESAGNAVIEVPNPHPLAGETLIFDVEIVEISKGEANSEEATVESGDTIEVHYTGTLENGEEFDSSRGKDTLGFTVGSGRMIAGFDTGVVGMKLSESKELTLSPDEAYGPKSFTQTIPLSRLQEFIDAGYDITPGTTLSTDRGEITIIELQQ